MMLLDTLLCLFGSAVVVGIALAIANPLLGRWACDWFGWHLNPYIQTFDGMNYAGLCPRCKRIVLRDSQGNWFAIRNGSKNENRRARNQHD